MVNRYLSDWDIGALKEILKTDFSPSQDLTEKQRKDFKIWFNTWIQSPIKTILESKGLSIDWIEYLNPDCVGNNERRF